MAEKCLFILFMILSGICSGQNTYDLLHIQLDSVTVLGKKTNPAEKANIGSRTTSISSQVLEGNRTQSMSELLSNNTMVYMKSLGQGALATSSFRGTSSNHTKVDWNGISINPPMSGNFDFSQIPVFFTDEVTLYHGNSYLNNGTGGLGGTISMANTANWQDSTRLRAFAEYGAWNSYTTAATARFLRAKALYQTRLYYQSSDNDYKYLNKVLQKNPFYEHRKEANYQQAGIMQEAYFQPSEKTSISTNLWFQYGDRRLPQPIVVYVTQHEKQKNTTLKYYLGLEHTRKKHTFAVKGAYQLDYLDYRKWVDKNNFPDSRNYNTAHVASLKFNHSYSPSPLLAINSSVLYNYNFIHADSYSQSRVQRNVFALQSNVLWTPASWMTLNGQVMGEVNDGRFAPTFSAGLSARIIENLLAFKANTAYNYHFPTLNDLYWQPGGNPDLKTEKGFSYDATLTFTPRLNGLLYFKVDATYYAMNIDNWIMWLPSPNTWYWSPANMMNVLSHGLELLTECNLILNDFKAKVGANYAYTNSTSRKKRFTEDNSYHKQLPYIPRHKGNMRLGCDYKNSFLSYQVSYTGVRYTTDDESYSTNAYWIHDAEIGHKFTTGKRLALTPKIRVNNLFNTYYESTEFYPMPLRNIFGSIVISF